MSKQVWLRCEADSEVGLGHWNRCQYLAIALASAGARVGFILNRGPDAVLDAVRAMDLRMHVMPSDFHIVDEVDHYPQDTIDAVVLDMSSRRTLSREGALPNIVSDLKARNVRSALIDGLGDCAYINHRASLADLVITPYYLPQNEAVRSARKWVKGAEYAMLSSDYNSEFVGVEEDVILLSMGGADPWGLTEKILDAFRAGLLSLPPGWSLLTVIGPFFGEQRAVAIQNQCEELGARFLAIENPAMIEIYRRSRAAILGPGLSKYEAVACGLRPIVVCPDPDDEGFQKPFLDARMLVGIIKCEHGGFSIDEMSSLIAKAIISDESNARRFIDGKGCMRVAGEIFKIIS